MKTTRTPSTPNRSHSAPQTHATADGTARYAARFGPRFAPDFFRPLAGTLRVSSIGLGTYLGQPDEADDERYASTVREALVRGVNLIDTAINYRCQRSERVIGRALRAAIDEGMVAREEVVLCSKGGYIPLDDHPPADRAAYRAYVEREFLAPGIMAPADVVAGGHCIAPSFLAHQLARSRANCGVERLDVYYLHNPEQQLDVIDRDELLARLRRAFDFLEERAWNGEIGVYGCATWNGFRVAPDTRGHLELAELVAIAREIGGNEHHFRVVQLPINLAMSEAVRLPSQRLAGEHRVPFLQAAAELGVSVVASAPLLQSQLCAGLPDTVRATFPGLTTDAQRAIAFVRALPGVTSALVGMRSTAHMEENLGAAVKAVEIA